MEPVGTHTKKQNTISKRHVFLMEKCFEDVRRDEKHVPDLLESIMRPTDPIKKRVTAKFVEDTAEYAKLYPKSKQSGFKLFEFRKSDVFPPEANASLLASRF